MKIFHLGLCVSPPPFNELQLSFIRNSVEYRELSTGDKDVNRKAVEIAAEFKPDLVFMQIQAANIILPSTVKTMQSFGAYVVNWNGDVRDAVPQWMYEIGADISLFTNMRDVKEMQSKGFKSDYLEIGYNEHIYCHDGPIIKTNEIVFFGNNYGDRHFPLSKFRREMVEFLQSRYGNRFGVYGTGWKKANGNFNHSQPEEAAAYRGAKIAINCSHYEIENYSSDRLLRILGTGVPICLCKWYPEIPYEDNKHLLTWKTLRDLQNLIDLHFEESFHDKKNITKSGMELVKQNFTFDHMVKNLISLYHANK